jgi:hypothetical protein
MNWFSFNSSIVLSVQFILTNKAVFFGRSFLASLEIINGTFQIVRKPPIDLIRET